MKNIIVLNKFISYLAFDKDNSDIEFEALVAMSELKIGSNYVSFERKNCKELISEVKIGNVINCTVAIFNKSFTCEVIEVLSNKITLKALDYYVDDSNITKTSDLFFDNFNKDYLIFNKDNSNSKLNNIIKSNKDFMIADIKLSNCNSKLVNSSLKTLLSNSKSVSATVNDQLIAVFTVEKTYNGFKLITDTVADVKKTYKDGNLEDTLELLADCCLISANFKRNYLNCYDEKIIESFTDTELLKDYIVEEYELQRCLFGDIV